MADKSLTVGRITQLTEGDKKSRRANSQAFIDRMLNKSTPAQHSLKAIREAAEDACRQAVACKETFYGEAVNWADLHCITSEHAIDDEANQTYRVYIEEAAPDCNRLCLFIAERLEAAGFPNVEVIAEW